MNTQKVWFVTGASKGLGLTLVKKLLAEGYQVAATSRSLKALTSEVGEQTENFLPLAVDLVNEQSVAQAIAATIQTFGAVNIGGLLVKRCNNILQNKNKDLHLNLSYYA